MSLPFFIRSQAGWQKGYAAACKAVYAGSSPTPASKLYSCFARFSSSRGVNIPS